MATVLQQINQIAAENSAANERLRTSLLGDVDAFNQIEQNKITAVKDRFELINSISQELGAIHGENVEERKSELINNIKSSIMKSRKLGPVNFGRTVDASKLKEFDQQIASLGRLAQNSRVIDQLYKGAVDRVDNDDLINDQDKGAVMQNIMRVLADRDKLEVLDMESLAGELSDVIRDGADPLNIINEIMGDVGTQTRQVQKDGETIEFAIPEVFDIDDNLNISISDAGTQQLARAIATARQGGYDISPERILPRFVDQFDTLVKQRFADPLDQALKEETLRGLRDKRISGKQQEKSREVFIEILQDPRSFDDPTGAGFDVTARRAAQVLEETGKWKKVKHLKVNEVRDLISQNVISDSDPITEVLRKQKIKKTFVSPENLDEESPKGYLMLDDGRNVEFIDLSKEESYNEIDGVLNSLPAEKRRKLLERDFGAMLETDKENFRNSLISPEGIPPTGKPKIEGF